MGGDVRGSLATARSSVSRSFTATASSLVATSQAGVVAAAVTSPSDLVKSRMMAQPVDAAGRGTLYATATDCYLKVVRAEGPLALFKGFHGQWLRIGPHTTVSLMAFEQARKLVGMSYL